MPADYSNTRTVDPAIEPVTIEQAKRNCDDDDSYRDADYGIWIPEARERLEHDARVALITQTWVHRRQKFDGCSFPLFGLPFPVASISSILYDDTNGSEQTLATTVYGVDVQRRPAVIYLKKDQEWPELYEQHDPIRITAVCGYGSAASDVPRSAITAILMMVRHRLDNPDLVTVMSGVTPSLMPQGWDSLVTQLRGGTYP